MLEWNDLRPIFEPISNNAHVRRILFPPTVAHIETRRNTLLEHGYPLFIARITANERG